MTEESTPDGRRDTLKALLGIEDAQKDVLVDFAIAHAEELIKNYCHIDAIPVGLSTTLLRMAADLYRNEPMGSDGIPRTVSSVTVGDTSTSFKTSASAYADGVMRDYATTLKSFRRVVF